MTAAPGADSTDAVAESSVADSALPGLALFPLHTVLFPGAWLPLRVFEARYLDLISACLRSGAPFGVVCLLQGDEVQRGEDDDLSFEPIGVLAHVESVDAEQSGILQVRCRGGRRFALTGPPRRSAHGLWQADATRWPTEPAQPLQPAYAAARDALRRAVQTLAVQGLRPFATPHRFDDAGWVANRWCELLPLPLPARQRLMALDDPLLRLQLVDEFLHRRGVLSSF